ncbi:hypothetical protein QQ045_007481 [Rhodiola kirilowii]
MAEDVLRASSSVDPIKSKVIRVRRTSLPIFLSDWDKDVPNYLRASTGSCHDHCKYGKKEATEVKQKQPGMKRNGAVPLVCRNVVLSKSVSMGKKVEAARLKASAKPKSTLSDPVELCKPEILPDDKTSKASFKQSASREKETIASEIIPKSLKPRKSVATSGSSKPERFETKRQLKIVRSPSGSWGDGRNNSDIQGLRKGVHNVNKTGAKAVNKGSEGKRSAKTVNKGSEGRKHGMVTESAKALSTHAAMNLNAREEPPSPTTRLKIAIKDKPRSSPPRRKTMEKARPYLSSTQLKPANVRTNLSSSSTTFKTNPATVNTSPRPSIPTRGFNSKKTINARDQIVQKRESSKVQASEAVATQHSFISSKTKVAKDMKKKEPQLEKLGEAEVAETNEFHEKSEGAPSHAAGLENQEVMKSGGEQAQEKTLYIIKMETGNKIELAPNTEDEIPNMQPFASLTPPLSATSQISVTVSNMSTQHDANQHELADAETALTSIEQETPDANQHELADAETALPCIEQETPDANQHELADAEAALPCIANQQETPDANQHESADAETVLPCIEQETPDGNQHELPDAETALPCIEQETPDIQPLPSFSPVVSPKSQSITMTSNTPSHYEESQDESSYTESEDGYSSYEDDHLVEREDLKGAEHNNKPKKSAKIPSEENGEDPVKLKFRRGRVIDIMQENHGPRRLKFRKAKVLEEKAANVSVRKSSFKMREATQTQDNATMDNNSETVALRHQDIQEKDAQGLFNNVIEETASKLVETRKSKVKALVGAFETVISLQDGKPTTT